MGPGNILSKQWHGYGYLKFPSQYFANTDHLLLKVFEYRTWKNCEQNHLDFEVFA
jgi:hypothetical protein